MLPCWKMDLMPADDAPKTRPPGLYDPGLDAKVEEMLDQYMEVHDKKHQDEYARIDTKHKELFYNTAKKHLSDLHGTDSDKFPTKVSFADYKNGDDPNAAKKAAQEHLNELILKAIELRYNKKRADDLRAAHKENPDDIMQYGNQILRAAQLDYDSAVDLLMESENILEDLHDPRNRLSQMMDAYVRFVSPAEKKTSKFIRHIVDEDNREIVLSYANKKMAEHGHQFGHNFQLKKNAKIDRILRELQAIASRPDEYKPSKRAAHITTGSSHGDHGGGDHGGHGEH
jgi:hypothetical protein